MIVKGTKQLGSFKRGINLYAAPVAVAPSPFSPTDISGLDLWLDASDGNTLYDATSGGNLVISNGSTVKRWEDKSGNVRHATNGTNGPTLQTSNKNSLNTLNFSTAKWITSTFSSKTYTSQTTFVVFRYGSSTGPFARAFSQSVSGTTDYEYAENYIPVLRNNQDDQFGSFANSDFRSLVSVSQNTWYIARSRHSGSAVTLRMNTTEGSSYNHSLNTSFEIFRIGATYLQDGGSDNADINDSVAEVLVYGKSLSDFESTSVTNYLNSKWAIY